MGPAARNARARVADRGGHARRRPARPAAAAQPTDRTTTGGDVRRLGPRARAHRHPRRRAPRRPARRAARSPGCGPPGRASIPGRLLTGQRRGHDSEPPAGLLEPPRQVDVLPVEEEVLPEAAHLAGCGDPYRQHRAVEPRHLLGRPGGPGRRALPRGDVAGHRSPAGEPTARRPHDSPVGRTGEQRADGPRRPRRRAHSPALPGNPEQGPRRGSGRRPRPRRRPRGGAPPRSWPARTRRWCSAPPP